MIGGSDDLPSVNAIAPDYKNSERPPGSWINSLLVRGAFALALLISLGISLASEFFARFRSERIEILNNTYSLFLQNLERATPDEGVYLRFDFPPQDTQYALNIFFLAVYWLYPQQVWVSVVPSQIFFPYDLRTTNAPPSQAWLIEHRVGTVITYTHPRPQIFSANVHLLNEDSALKPPSAVKPRPR